MDFDFSDDQLALRDAVAKWVEKSYDFERRRAIVAAGGFDRAAYGELAELGLAGICVGEDHGGLGMGPVEAMVVLEELGRGIVVEPLTQTFVVSTTLGAHGSDAVRQAWLPRIASGEALVVLAHQERKARYRLDTCEAQASATGGDDGAAALEAVAFVHPLAHGVAQGLLVFRKIKIHRVSPQAVQSRALVAPPSRSAKL